MKELLNYRKRVTSAQLFSPENLFLIIGYVFGLLLVFANPPFHSNDEDRHFYNAYFLSTGRTGAAQRGRKIGGYLPSNLQDVVTAYQGIPFRKGVKISEKMLDKVSRIPLQESSLRFYDNPSYMLNPVSYVPFVAGIWIAKFVNSNPIHLLWGARIAGLLSFLCIVFFAIKATPIHKHVLAALALNPMTLFQATSVSYDVLFLSLSFLLISLALKYAYRERPIGVRDWIVFLMVSLLISCVKSGYFLIPFLLFITPQDKIGSIQKSILMSICICITCFLPSVVWTSYLSSLHLQGGMLLLNDLSRNSTEQLKCIASDPFSSVHHYLLNFVVQGKEWLVGMMGRLGYSYTHLNHAVLFVHGLVLIALSLVDSSKKVSVSLRQKLIIGGIAFGTIVVISAGFFFISPIGSHFIFGLQGRYFIPVLPLLLLLNFNGVFWSEYWQKHKAVLFASYEIMLLGYTVYFVNSYFYQ